MPLEVNNQNLFQNAQFQQFVEFAEAAVNAGKQKAIARLDAGELGGIVNRTIKPGSGDWVGIGVGRLSSLKRANNATRDAFMKAVADMFGGVDHIPDSVKEAMKLDDYGKGKPLTARRILAVKAAIDSVKAAIDSITDTSSQAAEKTNACIQRGKETIRDKFLRQQGDVDKLIELAYKECQGNSDAMDIVENKLRSFVATGDNKIRSEAYVKERVEGLVANLKELKALSVKNPAIYEAGKEMLQALGKPLPPGMITKLVKGASEASLKDLAKLSGSSSGMAIHTAIMQTIKSVDGVMSSSGAKQKLFAAGSEEVDQARDFVLNVMMSRCSKATLVNINNAFANETTGHLMAYYEKCEKSREELFPNEPAEVQSGAGYVGSLGSISIKRIAISVDVALARLDPNVRPQEFQEIDEPDINRIGGNKLLKATVAQGKEINEQNTQAYLDDTVAGSGKGADAMKQVIRNKFGGAATDPVATLGRRLNANANAMINWQICTEMKKFVTGEESWFEKDINRRLNVTLTDGKNTFKLTNDFKTARDELARFVTGDANATYDSILDHDRNKVNVLMSLLSQEFEKAGEDGVEYALDKREAEQGFTIEPDKSRPPSRTFTLEISKNGYVSLEYSVDKPIKSIATDDYDDGINLGAGSTYKAKIRYELSAEKFSRFADLDYSKFDNTEADKLFNRKQDMPDGTRKFAEQKNIKAVESFPEEFRIKASKCAVGFEMVLNPTDQDLIDAQR